jgi:hypothetical protein
MGLGPQSAGTQNPSKILGPSTDREDSPRLGYLYDTYIATAMSRVGLLLRHLAETGRIRPIPLRTFYFLVIHGGAASHTLIGLAQRFDPTSPLAPGEVEENAALVADLIIAGLRLPPDLDQSRKEPS